MPNETNKPLEMRMDYFTELLFSHLLQYRQAPNASFLTHGLAVPPEDKYASASEPINEEQLLRDTAVLKTAYGLLRAERNDISTARFNYICDAFRLELPEQIALFLGLCPFLNRKYEQVFSSLNCDLSAVSPSIGVVWVACRAIGLTDQNVLHILLSRASLQRWFVLPDSCLTLSTTLQLREPIVAAFHGVTEIDSELRLACTIYSPSQDVPAVTFNQDFIKQALDLTTQYMHTAQGPLMIALVGRKGAGRRFSICRIADHLNTHVFFINAKLLIAGDTTEVQSRIGALRCEALLHPGLIALTDCDGIQNELALLNAIEEMTTFSPLLLVSTEEGPLSFLRQVNVPLYEMTIPVPSHSESERLFEQLSKSYLFANDAELHKAVRGFRLLPGDIQRSLESAHLTAFKNGRNAIVESDLKAGISAQRGRIAGSVGAIIKPRFQMADLITTEANKEILKLAASHIKYRGLVGEQWGMDSKNAYGNGTCVLFYGPPGTGKTMAAHVLAHEVGMDIFKINTAQLISKYIGETAKNLDEVFRQAGDGNLILFFDEADSIFGKRSQINDSHDRYANNDTSFLLQRIEEYEGMTILATNLASNIDEAFKRRITYVLKFALPEQEERKALWESMVRGLPTGNMDYAYLSKFELSGSGIKSIITSACYMAASCDEKICMSHIAKAIWFYQNKSGLNPSRSELAPYY